MFGLIGTFGILCIVFGFMGWTFFGGISCLPVGIILVVVAFIGGWYTSPQRQAALLEKALKEREAKDE